MSHELGHALERASYQGDLEKVQTLVNPPSNPTAEDLIYALAAAAERCHVTVVSFLLDRGAEINAPVAILATKGRSPAVFQAFLDHGWDINSKDRTGASVLRLVVSDEALVKWFLEHGADPNIHSDRDGVSPLDIAASISTTAVIALFLEHGARVENSNALHAAARGRSGIPMMGYLLDQGVDINALEHQHNPEYFERRKHFGFGTALHCAAQRGSKERIQYLLERGADREIKNTIGYTPAQWAKRFGCEGCHEMLKQ